MAKEKTEAEILAKKEKKEKKEKKRKHSEVADDVEIVAEKKKKDKKRKSTDAAVSEGGVVVDTDGDVIVADAAVKDEDEDEEKKDVVKVEIPLQALVPFANPLCDDKSQKKVFKVVKKAAKSKALKRGVKECVKAIRKSPMATPSTIAETISPHGIVVLAADISPMDVISHIPVLCEDHGIPYIYVPSRAELGAAGSTKRPTSIVMVSPKAGKGVEAADEWEGVYGDLSKIAVKLGQGVKV